MILVDTGFLVSAFEPREKQHLAAIAWLSQHSVPLITLEAVLCECCFFLRGKPRQQLLSAVSQGALSVQHPDSLIHWLTTESPHWLRNTSIKMQATQI